MIKIDKDRAIRVAGILAIAWGSGFLMQNTNVFGNRGAVRVTPGMHLPVRAAPAAPEAAPAGGAGQPAAAPRSAPTPPDEAKVPAGFHLFSPADPGRFESRLASHSSGALPDLAAPPAAPQLAAAGCAPRLDVTARPGGRVGLALQAPCDGAQRIAVRAGAIDFAAKTDPNGAYRAEFPVLDPALEVQVRLADGRLLKQDVRLPDLAGTRRIALVWEGPDALQIRPSDPASGLVPAGFSASGAEAGARIYRLGDPATEPARMAMIVDLPDHGVAAAGVPFIVEAELNAASCARPLTAHLHDSRGALSGEISMILPPCDGQSGYLQLKNFMQDLKIARN